MKKIMTVTAMLVFAISMFAKDIKTVVFTTLPQMHCENCENKIKGNLRFEKGIKQITTSVPDLCLKAQPGSVAQWIGLDSRSFGRRTSCLPWS
jgi:periplasmic mercuric ion binding protein